MSGQQHQVKESSVADEKDEITPIIEDDKMLDKVGKKDTPDERAEEFLKELKKKK